jgi:hypothetical protein
MVGFLDTSQATNFGTYLGCCQESLRHVMAINKVAFSWELFLGALATLMGTWSINYNN